MKPTAPLLPTLLVSLLAILSGCDSSSADKTSPITVGPGTPPSTGGGTGSGTGSGTGTVITPPPLTTPGTGTTLPSNSAPVALPDVAVVQIGSTGNPVNVLANDHDANGDSLSISAVSIALSVPPNPGSLAAIATDGKSLRYTPAAGFIGTQTLLYTVSDGHGGVASALAVITVSPLAVPPAALPDVFTKLVDAPITTLDVLANDVDGAGGGLVVSAVSSIATVPPSNAGTASVVNGALRYQPKPGFIGVETLSYTLSDANGATATAAVVITVLPLAAPPVALPDVATLNVGASSDLDVLANDVDLAGGGLSLTAVTALTSLPPGSEGGFTIVNNRVRYVPSASTFIGTQTATYTLNDQNGATGTGLITIVVTPALPTVPPLAVPDVATRSTGATGFMLDVLANDVDVAGGGLTITDAEVLLGLPDSAGVTVSTTGSNLQLALPATYAGVLTLSYTITDANGAAATTAVIVTVAPAALPTVPPLALPDVATVSGGSTTATIDVLLNDIDVAGGGLTITAADVALGLPNSTGVTASTNGSSVQLNLPANYVGVLTLSYTIADANGSTATSAVVVTVSALGLPAVGPLAVADVASRSSGITTATLDVLANDIDVAGSGLTITAAEVLLGLPDSTGVTVSTSGSNLQLTLPATYAGVLTLSYTITDANGAAATTAVIVTVAPAALPTVPPVPLPDLATLTQDSSVNTIDVLANDVDPAAGGLTLTTASVLVSLPTATHTVAVAGNQVQFTPAAAFAGVVTLSYTVTDANGASADGLLTITVAPALPIALPAAVGDVGSLVVTLLGGSTGNFDVLANDIDPAGAGLTLQSVRFQNPLLATVGSALGIVGNQVQLTVPLLGLITGVLPIEYTAVDRLGRTITGVLNVTILS